MYLLASSDDTVIHNNKLFLGKRTLSCPLYYHFLHSDLKDGAELPLAPLEPVVFPFPRKTDEIQGNYTLKLFFIFYVCIFVFVWVVCNEPHQLCSVS